MSTKFCLVKKQRNLNPMKICASTLCFITFSCLLKVRYLRYMFYAQIIYFLEWSDHILCTPSISHTVYSYTVYMYHCITTRNSSTKLHNKVILYMYLSYLLCKPCLNLALYWNRGFLKHLILLTIILLISVILTIIFFNTS